MTRLLIVSTLALSTWGCAAQPRANNVPGGTVDTGPGSVEAARKFLEGRWSLISYDVFPPGRPAIRIEGSGTLTYDAFSNLDMQIRVPDAATSEALERAGIPLKDGIISTGGRTAIDVPARTLVYMIEGGRPLLTTADSGPLGLNRPRHWEVEGQVLTLTIRGDDGQPLSVGRWQKQ